MPTPHVCATQYGPDVGVLLSQLGFYSAALFAEQLSSVKPTPALAGIVRAVAAHHLLIPRTAQ